jgi:hypothetical protein
VILKNINAFAPKNQAIIERILQFPAKKVTGSITIHAAEE